jgi:hypothetical protein
VADDEMSVETSARELGHGRNHSIQSTPRRIKDCNQ